ncbi:MAG: PatB family C-S lyase [Pseudomonadota bacterium]
MSSLRARQGEKWSHYSNDVIPAWVADMDFQLAAPIREAIVSRIERFDCGYPVAARDTGLPEIFVERVAKKFNWPVNVSQVDLFNDVVQAIYFGLLSLSDSNDAVLIQTPIYPPFISSIEETGRQLVTSPLVQGVEKYEIDFDHLESQIISAKAKLLLFCNPHNPSGRCFTKTELERLTNLVLEHDMYVISDEIHADLVLDGCTHIPLASLSSSIAERTVTLMSASKTFNMAGVCMAFAVFGSDDLKRRFKKVPRHLRGAVSALSVAGVSAAFNSGEPWLNAVLERLRTNRDLLFEHIKENWSGIRYLGNEATYLAWLDCRQLLADHKIEQTAYQFFLEHARVALSDGARFGEPGIGFARLNFATSANILEEIIQRMDKSLQAHCA